jgi:hypothetical protein
LNNEKTVNVNFTLKKTEISNDETESTKFLGIFVDSAPPHKGKKRKKPTARYLIDQYGEKGKAKKKKKKKKTEISNDETESTFTLA